MPLVTIGRLRNCFKIERSEKVSFFFVFFPLFVFFFFFFFLLPFTFRVSQRGSFLLLYSQFADFFVFLSFLFFLFFFSFFFLLSCFSRSPRYDAVDNISDVIFVSTKARSGKLEADCTFISRMKVLKVLKVLRARARVSSNLCGNMSIEII